MADLAIVLLVFIGLLLLLYLSGIPVAIAMGITSIIVGLSPLGASLNLGVIGNQMLHGVNSFTLLAIPFYVLLGRLMNRIGMTERIFRFANALVGQFRGGIAQVNVLASIIFSGMSGVAVADAAGLGRIEYKAMRDHGYEKDISIGVTGASTIIGPIIPPSVPIIIYALLAGESIGALFLAGVIPGLLLGLSLMVTIYLVVRHRGYAPAKGFNWKELKESFIEAFAAILTPMLILGGILSGFFTATEAGAVSVLYVVLLGVWYGELSSKGLMQELRDSMVETFSLTFIIAVASLYGLVAVQLRLPILMIEGLTGVSENQSIILLMIVMLLLVVGTFMDTTAALTILIPVLMPVIDSVGIDPIHFGIITILTLMIGLLTPPFGVILFVLEKVTDATLEEIFKSIVLYYIPLLIVLVLVIFVPELSTYIPTNLL